MKGKDTPQILLEEVRAIVDAFKKGPAEGELALALGPRDRTPPAAFGPAPRRTGKVTSEIVRERQETYHKLNARAPAKPERFLGEPATLSSSDTAAKAQEPEQLAAPPFQNPQEHPTEPWGESEETKT